MENKVVKRFSKSSSFYTSIKRDFFDDNSNNLKNSILINKKLADSGERINCYLCLIELPQKHDFINHSVPYVFCTNCTHLNSVYTDSGEFNSSLYVLNDKSYAKNYDDDDYRLRIKNIYAPKLDFLISTIGNNIKILDFGCGAGYFVNAALDMQISALGVDVSTEMVKTGNDNILKNHKVRPLSTIAENEIFTSIINSDATVLTAIGVIEHLSNPAEFFSAFKTSNIQYLYYSVPMFSLSVFLENIFLRVFPRHLSGGHTHLFTENSIIKLNELLGCVPISEWRFGSDFLDLFRSISVSLKQNDVSDKALTLFQDNFEKNIDAFQSIQDQSSFTSEIHAIVRKY
jgi:SAM-dependent methyltransferase